MRKMLQLLSQPLVHYKVTGAGAMYPSASVSSTITAGAGDKHVVGADVKYSIGATAPTTGFRAWPVSGSSGGVLPTAKVVQIVQTFCKHEGRTTTSKAHE